jgi:hypothetical protein
MYSTLAYVCHRALSYWYSYSRHLPYLTYHLCKLWWVEICQLCCLQCYKNSIGLCEISETSFPRNLFLLNSDGCNPIVSATLLVSRCPSVSPRRIYCHCTTFLNTYVNLIPCYSHLLIKGTKYISSCYLIMYVGLHILWPKAGNKYY